MIITCPECAARYDVADDRFSPNGRSVRCTACGESWYVPAPEPLDMAPIEDLKQSARAADKAARGEEAEKSAEKTSSRLKVRGIEATLDGEDDDSLFDEPADQRPARVKGAAAKAFAPAAEADDLPRDERGRFVSRKKAVDDEIDEPVEKGWRKGKKFIVEDEDADDVEREPRRSIFSRRKRANEERDHKSGHKGGERRVRREQVREALRFSDAVGDEADAYDDLYEDDRGGDGTRFAARRRAPRARFDDDYDEPYNDGYDRDSFAAGHDSDYHSDYDDDFEADLDHDGDATIVDADFEDVDGYKDGVRPRGFGRRIRAERRRATAVARVEDVAPFSAEYFDDEFFASLRVTPKELERALRKARRRAESREKNRMTPWRAFGWTAWAAMVAGVVYLGVNFRDDIVRIAPQAADAYAVIGIETNPAGLSIDNVRHRLAMSTSGPTIEITGSLRNDTDAEADAPLLQAEALGARGELLSRWTFSASETAVSQGTSVDFVTRAPAPEGVAEVALSFAPTQGAVRNLLTDSR